MKFIKFETNTFDKRRFEKEEREKSLLTQPYLEPEQPEILNNLLVLLLSIYGSATTFKTGIICL